MRTLVIIAHPKYDDSTTQQFFKAAVADFSTVTWHRLGASINVERERELIGQNDRIIFQFPLYWYSAPAILKKWLDDVLTSSYATGDQFALQGKELGLVVTTGDAQHDFQAGAGEQFTLSELLRPYQAMASKLKMTYLTPLVVYQFAYLEQDQQQRLLVNYQQYVTNSAFASFTGQQQWFGEQLQQLIDRESDETRKTRLSAIQQTLTDNMDAIDDLNWALKLMKNKEDD